MKYHVIRIMNNGEQQNTRLVYAYSDDGENEILELGIDWMEKNEIEVGDWLITDEKGYIRKYDEEEEAANAELKDPLKECLIKALLDDYESKCKLAELLLEYNEYDRNAKASFNLIEKMYNNIRFFSENNGFKDDFCDIAIKYGDYFYNGIGVKKNKMYAYKYYLEAKTIYEKCRNNIGDYDEKLYKAINKRINRYESEKHSLDYDKIVTRSFVRNYPFFLLDVLASGTSRYRMRVILSRVSETEYRMKLVRIGISGSGNNELVPRFLITIPEQELCIYSRELNVTLKGVNFMNEYQEQFVVDSFVYDQNSEELTFILNDQEMMKAQVNYMEIESN